MLRLLVSGTQLQRPHERVIPSRLRRVEGEGKGGRLSSVASCALLMLLKRSVLLLTLLLAFRALAIVSEVALLIALPTVALL